VHKLVEHFHPCLNLNGRETVVRVVIQMLRHEAEGEGQGGRDVREEEGEQRTQEPGTEGRVVL
jgi:hypothetical protein